MMQNFQRLMCRGWGAINAQKQPLVMFIDTAALAQNRMLVSDLLPTHRSI